MTMEQELRLTVKERIAHVVIERAQARNALHSAHWARLQTLLEQAEQDDAIRVLWLQGLGGSFCSGADLAELQAQQQDGPALLASAALVQQVQKRMQISSLCTLALVDGVCMGGGLGLALCCDFRLATPDSRFALSPARLGLRYSPADTRRLVHAVGMPRARDMLLRGHVVSAQQALDWGLVTELVSAEELLPRAQQISAELMAGAPQALAGIKQTLAWAGGDDSFGEASLLRGFREAFSSPEFIEGTAAFFDKRKPDF